MDFLKKKNKKKLNFVQKSLNKKLVKTGTVKNDPEPLDNSQQANETCIGEYQKFQISELVSLKKLFLEMIRRFPGRNQVLNFWDEICS